MNQDRQWFLPQIHQILPKKLKFTGKSLIKVYEWVADKSLGTKYMEGIYYA